MTIWEKVPCFAFFLFWSLSSFCGITDLDKGMYLGVPPVLYFSRYYNNISLILSYGEFKKQNYEEYQESICHVVCAIKMFIILFIINIILFYFLLDHQWTYFVYILISLIICSIRRLVLWDRYLTWNRYPFTNTSGYNRWQTLHKSSWKENGWALQNRFQLEMSFSQPSSMPGM